MRYCLITILLLSFLTACKKETEKQENLYIRGRLFLTDTLTQNSIDQPLAGKAVQLAENNGDSLNFLYTDTTDSQGYFVFNLLNTAAKDKGFVVWYEEKAAGYWYTAKDTVVKGQDNIALEARLSQTKQNGFYAYAMDSTGGGMPGATVYLYNSLALADINDPTTAVETFTANNTGRFVKINLTPGVYYLNAKRQAGTFLFQRLKKQLTVPAKGIIKPFALPYDSITLRYP